MKCICGREFESKRKDAKFCSALCRKRDSRGIKCDTDNVTDKLSVTEVVTDKCLSCNFSIELAARNLEIKKLLAKISLLELQIKKGIKSEPLPTGDSAEDLYKRNLAAKDERFRHYGLSAH